MLKYIILFLFLLLNLNSSIACTVLNGGVSYTVSRARTIAFDGIVLEIPIEKFKTFFVDKRRLNIKYTKTIFSDGTYALRDRQKDKGFYYSSEGRLESIEMKVSSHNFNKYARYDMTGKLDSVVLDIDNNEQFIFDANKKLVAHWIGKNGYNEKGELILTRD